jgi:hypothetical protein
MQRECFAVGTGLSSTKKLYPNVYNPSDPQRDIIWLKGNSHKLRARMKGNTEFFGLDAGLQVKVSTDGIGYVLKDLLKNKYEVPVVYFDVNKDFYKVADRVYASRQKLGLSPTNIEEDFIHAKSIDYEGYNEVCHYVDLVTALVDGRLTPEDLLNETDKYPSLKNAVLATAFECMPDEMQIVKTR